MHITYWVAFSLYFITLFVIGYCVKTKQTTSCDMFIGGRKVNFWVTALSAQASDMGCWLFMAVPMSLYVGGMPQFWSAISLIIGMFCSWHFVAPRFRAQTELYNCYTMPSYLVKRFQDTKNVLRIISSIACILFLTHYVAAGLIAIGLLFESIFAIDYQIVTFTASCVMVAYIFAGGFVSVAWVDMFQSLFLLSAIIIVSYISYGATGGIDNIISAAKNAQIPLELITANTSLKDIFYPLFGWGFGYFGMPHIITKFMGIEHAKDLVKSKYLGITWQIIALTAAASIGLISIAYFPVQSVDPELLFVTMVKQLFPPLLGGFILCGFLAATVSTMDSQLLVAASVLTEDIVKHYRANIDEKKSITIFRVVCIFIAACAFFISLSRNTTIMDAVYYAWAGLGTSFAPAILASLYSKTATKKGVIASISFGCIFSASWPMLNKFLYNMGILDAIPSMIIGFPVGLAILFSVSYFDARYSLRTSS